MPARVIEDNPWKSLRIAERQGWQITCRGCAELNTCELVFSFFLWSGFQEYSAENVRLGELTDWLTVHCAVKTAS
jgi:hypothetical protein